MNLSNKFLRFIIVGGVNTFLSIALTTILYKILQDHIMTFFIVMLSYIISIFVSFFTQKVFVFNTQGYWMREYASSLGVYGVIAVVSSSLIHVLVEIWYLDIILSQIVVIPVVVSLSFMMQSKFTFSNGSRS